MQGKQMCGTVRLPVGRCSARVKALHSITQSRDSKRSFTFSKLYSNLVKLNSPLSSPLNVGESFEHEQDFVTVLSSQAKEAPSCSLLWQF